ncbi:MAG: gas vesicle protein [Acidimicrobiaceae bacterium]|nr:gas vesicle protein [Acidimicrobiaceae bacterium]
MSSNDQGSIKTIISKARNQMEELTGRSAEAITAVERNDGGWRLNIELLELQRIPDSTSILGCYEVRVDGDGNLLDYVRTARYFRNHAIEEEA